MIEAPLGTPGPPRHALPRRAIPFQYETIESYVNRLAEANHASSLDMRCYLSGAWNKPPHPAWLAAASGYPVETLQSRLIGLKDTDPNSNARTKTARPACRKCMARRGVHTPVMIIRPAHHTVCHRHYCWTGPAATSWENQLPLHDRPDVIRAARTHQHLVRTHPSRSATFALRDASRILVRGGHHTTTAETVHDHINHYPDTIALANLIATHRPALWSAISSDDHPRAASVRTRLLNAVHHLDYSDTVTTSVAVWIDDQNYPARRNTSISPTARAQERRAIA